MDIKDTRRPRSIAEEKSPETQDTSTKPRETLSNLAKEGAAAFVAGNVIGGVGIAGLLLLFSSILIAIREPLSEISVQLNQTVFNLLLFMGVLLIIFSGILYYIRKLLEHRLLLSLVNGHKEVTLAYIEKLNPGTVNADQVIKLAEQYDTYLVDLIGSKKQ